MFVFDVTGAAGERAEIRVQALDWGQSGPVTFHCDDDRLAVLLLTDCRCDAVGFFNLLAGCKPLYLEQWLSYLQETGRIAKQSCQLESPAQEDYLAKSGLEHEELNALLGQVYQVAGFNRLQINRYLKNRHNPTALATRYDQKELERYRQLNDIILTLLKLKHPQ
ncbi:hypothetical protein [Aeromonas dhakensis]|uniref:Uncharacterized protein n=1 Tax=Aeromonas dhakensis TaxID=196024 RepID=K1K9M2_9GAMM|nr:hypothetical protein [Aeromonas dhakensis]EKB28364.1 hypothetical protein HMPREF1171_01598 [Aeromonas dhakensis]MBL0524223.1 hypothetical protein [Aeromonas dhakensis]BEE09540.1 hypothetical protein VAWG003_23490 [Aeromonas dhakensis]BEE26424.1 hypothetical protein VAWG005_23520 [Aeromonas dhakensis]HDX8371090.1 hypothetical protein [Aeromonas dhakensis]